MSNQTLNLCILLTIFSLPLVAEPPKPVDKVLDQATISPETAKRIPAPPLPSGNPKLDAIRERVKNVQQQHSQYLADVASGKVIPFADLREMRPHQLEQLKELQKSYDALLLEKDPKKVGLLSHGLLTALQPIGPYLMPADIGNGYANYLSPQQVAELDSLEAAWEDADRDYNTDAKALNFLVSRQMYTLTKLGVPLIVSAPPASTVIFQTHGGGFFTNKLPYISVQADAAGFATAEWVSYGDSVGDTTISARCENAPPALDLTITTVQLKLNPLPDLPNPGTLTPPSAPSEPSEPSESSAPSSNP
jgi:hypothetical protein